MQRGTTFAMEGQTDAQLVTLARAGDASAFCQLVERSQVIASVMAFRLIADRETIREVIQEATLQAFLSLDRLRDTTRFKPWFYGIVLNVCRTWLREHNTRTLSLEALTTEWQTATQSPLLVAPDPHEQVEEQELRQLVQETVRGLSPNTSSVIWLFYYEQLSIQEIAARLDISLSAVRNRLHNGRNELRRQLQIAYPDIVQRKPSTPGKRRRKTMIQVTLAQIVPRTHYAIVVLLDAQGQRVLPLWLRRKEDYWLVQRFRASSQEEMLPAESSTVDFMDQLLDAIRDTIEEVRIEVLQDELLYAAVRLRGASTPHEIETRIGMGLTVALRVQCPIVVPERVMKTLGMPLPEGETQDQKLALLVQTLEKHLPPSLLITHTLRVTKHPQNLDFREGTQGWHFEGSQGPFPHFDYGIDPSITHQGHASLSLKTKEGVSKANGDLRQTFQADTYRGKRLRLSGYLKTENVGGTGLWIAVEGLNEMLRTADMQERPIRGTQEWTRRELEVEVPAESISIAMGLRVFGTGQVWLADIDLEVVGEDVPSTVSQ